MAVVGFSGCGGSGSGETKETSGNKTEAEAEFTPALDTDSAGTLSVAGFMGNFEALDQVVIRISLSVMSRMDLLSL